MSGQRGDDEDAFSSSMEPRINGGIVSRRVCDRKGCPQRAFPALGKRLRIDED